MYAYDELDRTLINERVEEFRDQVRRRLSGELTEDEFKMLRWDPLESTCRHASLSIL